MAITSNAGQTVLVVRNNFNVTPPVVFADYGSDEDFSYSIWAKVLDNTTPEVLLVYQGTTGSRLIITAQVGFWMLEFRNESVVFAQHSLGVMKLNTWTAFCIVNSGVNVTVYRGDEDPTQDVPVHLTQILSVANLIRFPFDFVGLVATHNMAICNFRYFDVAFTAAEVDIHVNRWHVNGPHVAKWSSTLRLPGDISNIADPYTSPDWAGGHAFTQIGPGISNLVFHTPDPVWLAKHEPCPVWVYAVPGTGFVFFNPGVTPTVPTTYKSTISFAFEDRGTVPEGPLENVTYYAYPFANGVIGPGPVSSYPLYTNESDVELVTDLNDPTQRFEQDTGVLVPTVIAPNFYVWKFGGQFTWAAGAAIPTATGNLGYPYLYVVYIGFPTGKPSVIVIDDLAGLFAIKKDQLVDKYYRSTKLKIPDPTIRTAYIGE
jgi:hypothetical protein